MGARYTKELETVVCHDVAEAAHPDEFQLSVDQRAFQFHFVKRVPLLRINKLSTNGSWLPMDTNVFTVKQPYVDPYVNIAPANDIATLTVLHANVQFLHAKGREPEDVVCMKGDTAVVYVRLSLRKQSLQMGKSYEIADDSILLCDNKYILIVNMPEGSKALKTTSSSVDANSNALLLFLAHRPVEPML